MTRRQSKITAARARFALMPVRLRRSPNRTSLIPTSAFPTPRLSYANPRLHPRLSEKLEGWLYGCDICQDVCPWNRFEQVTEEPRFQPRTGNVNAVLAEVLDMTHETYATRFRGSAMKRAKLSGLQRNARTLLQNRARSELVSRERSLCSLPLWCVLLRKDSPQRARGCIEMDYHVVENYSKHRGLVMKLFLIIVCFPDSFIQFHLRTKTNHARRSTQAGPGILQLAQSELSGRFQ